MMQLKRFDLAYHFSFNQNKVWANWRSNRSLLYNKPSILYQWKYICPSYRHVWESLIFFTCPVGQLYYKIYLSDVSSDWYRTNVNVEDCSSR